MIDVHCASYKAIGIPLPRIRFYCHFPVLVNSLCLCVVNSMRVVVHIFELIFKWLVTRNVV